MTIESFLKQLTEHCGVESDLAEVTIEEDEDYLKVQLNLPEEETGRFIGFHGETLESLQRITRVVFQDDFPNKRVVLNINSYRQDREEKLVEIVESVASRVLETGETYTFQSYMPANERYIIHSSLSKVEGGEQLESFSTGEGRNRRLSIGLKNENGESNDAAENKELGQDTDSSEE